jgi:hypothetical protein
MTIKSSIRQIGAILLTGLIALALQGDESGATAQNATMHTQAKLP